MVTNQGLMIDTIFVNEIGKITSGYINGKLYYREKFLELLPKCVNILDSDETSFTLNINQLKYIKFSDDFCYRLYTRGMYLKEVKVQVTETKEDLLLVDEITIYLPDDESREKLLSLGFQETSEENCIKADARIIYTLRYNNEYIEEHLKTIGILSFDSSGIVIYNERENKAPELTKVIRSDTYIKKLNTWKAKMQMLGEYENYDIVKNIYLKTYKCHSSSPIFPPVVKICRGGLRRSPSVQVNKLKVPDSVKICNLSMTKGIKEIELSENTLNTDYYTMFHSSITEANLKNIITQLRFSSAWEKVEANLCVLTATGVEDIVSHMFDRQIIKLNNI